MSDRKVSGKDILLFIDPEGGTDYKTVVCLTSQTYTHGSTPVTDATTKCGPDSLPGIPAPDKIDFEGVQLFDPATGKLAIFDLSILKKNVTTIGWKMAPVEPLGGDVIKVGRGFISDLSESYPIDNSTFSGSISVYGTPDITEALGTPSAPTINNIVAGDEELTVNFTIPDSNGGSAITNYKYSINGGSSYTACSPTQTVSPIIISGLTNDTVYPIEILAVNANGDGTGSNVMNATPTD